jgi:hypothetical protein
MFVRVAVLFCALLAGACTTPGTDGDPTLTGSTSPGLKEIAKAELPQCAQPLGSVALVENQAAAPNGQGLPSPLPLLNAMIAQSGCFRIAEAPKAAPGGKGKAAKTDYLMSADMAVLKPDAGGGENADAISSFFSGIGGAESDKTPEVRATLFLSSTKTGLPLTSVQGVARTPDAGPSFDRIAKSGAKLGPYADTPAGKTATAAFLDAYLKLVNFVKAAPKPKAQPKVVAKR